MLNVPLSDTLRNRLVPAVGDTPDVRSIVMVGARLDNRFSRKLMNDDRTYLKNTFKICAERDLVVSPDVEVSACNLEYGHDFLQLARDGRVKADMIVYNWLCYAPSFIGVARLGPLCMQSPLATEYSIWHEAPEKADARFVMNVHAQGMHDLPTEYITRGDSFKLGENRKILDKTYDFLMR